MYKKPSTSWFKHLDFILIDIISVNISFVLAYCFRFGYNMIIYEEQSYQNIILVACIFCTMLSLFLHTHADILKRSFFAELKSVLVLALFNLLFMAIYVFSLHISEAYSRIVIYSSVVIFFFIDLVFRMFWKHLLIKSNGLLNFNRDVKNAFIYTEGKYIDKILKCIEDDKFSNFCIKGITLTTDFDKNIDDKYQKISVENSIDFLIENSINDVIIFSFDDDEKKETFILKCKEMGLTTHEIISLSRYDNLNSFIENFGDYYMVTRAFSSVSVFEAFVKRTMDIVGGIIGLIFTGIIGIIIGPLIYLKSPGPIIYKQVRVGMNGKKFIIYKFRSMVINADEIKKDLMNENIMKGNIFKLDFDPRIIGNEILPDGTKKTGIGQLIRKMSLDEFPQFFNVLKGDMSLVGTRPPTVDEWNKYENHHRARLAWKPGITGLWQVSGRNDISDFEEIVKLDTKYISNFSIWLDIKIIIATVFKVFKCDGK